MAIIHRTTMSPTKLELLTDWLPTRPWYVGTGREPELSRTGGFRLDDPEGEVGIEFLVATDGSGPAPVSYHVPLTYRGAPLEGAEHALVGTSEHGVLGRRWIYDGTHDPVLVAQLLALLQGRAEPQAQSRSNTPDPSVTVRFTGTPVETGVVAPTVTDGSHATRIAVEATGSRSPSSPTLRVTRLLEPGSAPADATGHVTAGWRSPDGGEHRGVFAALHGARS
ncbi:1,4-alpha-glucan branching protein [Streptomyces sp. NPDC001848]|uniref:maltokinase N-terminal cap-like domain-containing protein n=1 Tax=Streptomyces sp. NPDC001848 TaxID=3364618 RepID=UPI0036BA5A2B